MSSQPNCPICEDAVEGIDKNDSFPFCSKRCKQVDMGRWFDESYTVPVTPHSTERRFDPDDNRDDDED